MNQVLPPDAHNQQYAGMLALYIRMRDKGSTHADSVETLP
jgi:hypothetical protein